MITFDASLRLGDFVLEARFESDSPVTALFGASGAGKTTIVNLFAGLLRPDRGEISAGGRLLTSTSLGLFVPVHKRRAGLVYQDAQLFPHMTVAQNLGFGSWFNKRYESEVPRQAVIAALGLAPLLRRRPARLSGGERQRVALGRALLSAPRLLLLDEPLSGLDQARKGEILNLIARIRDEFRIPIIYVSHAASEVERLAAQVIEIENGRVVGGRRAKP